MCLDVFVENLIEHGFKEVKVKKRWSHNPKPIYNRIYPYLPYTLKIILPKPKSIDDIFIPAETLG